MSCSCNCSPCNCQPRPSVCCTPTVESVEYTFENANLVGIGVFDNDTDNLVQFRGIVSNSAALTVSLDAPNVAIVLDFDQAALVADIPDADTTTRGILETATNAEALAKAATDKILVPSNLAALGASDTFAGLAEFATNAETIAGLSASLAVTPAGLASTIRLSNTVTWADAVARNAATPAFEGQFGVQLDTNEVFVSFGTLVGDFSIPVFTGNTTTTVGANTSWAFNGMTLFMTNGLVDTSTSWVFSDGYIELGKFGQTEVVNYVDTELQLLGVTIPAASVLTTNLLTAGKPSSRLLTTFISTENTQTGWGTPSSTLARTTFATYAGQVISNPPTQAEVQAIDDELVIVSQRLGALITDLLAVKLPAA